MTKEAIQEEVDDEELIGCETCQGTGEVEEMEYECNDSTGYNTIAMGTGRMIPCHDCSL